MIGNKDKLEILDKLYKDGFVRSEDLESKILELFKELDDNDKNALVELRSKINDTNTSEKSRIDFFHKLIEESKEILTIQMILLEQKL